MVDRVEVAADLDTDAFAEVTFVARVDDGEYVPIGTDDNAPYRVFYDASELPEGSTLSFGAIVNDLAGHIASDSVSGVTVDVVEPPPPGPGGPAYAIIHYNRPNGDYGDHTTGDFNDFWGLHAWGDIDETIVWTSPKPFVGEDEYGRFAWVKLNPGAANVGFIVHKGDTKDGSGADRFFDPSVTPEIWLKAGDDTIYTSQADAQGYVTIRYHRPDGDYGDPNTSDFWGLHLWGDAIDPSEATDWTAPKKPTGIDEYGAFWNIQIVDSSKPVNFIVHRGDVKDPGPDQSMIPADDATIWLQSGDATIYASKGAATNVATIHYHRDAGDYGDPSSTDFNDFWGLHVWTGAATPTAAWTIRCGGITATCSVRRSRCRSPQAPSNWRTSSTAVTPRIRVRTSSSTWPRTGTRCGSCKVPTRRTRTSSRCAPVPACPVTSAPKRRTGSARTRSCGTRRHRPRPTMPCTGRPTVRSRSTRAASAAEIPFR